METYLKKRRRKPTVYEGNEGGAAWLDPELIRD